MSEEDEKYLSDEVRVPANNEARVCSKQEVYTPFEKENLIRSIKQYKHQIEYLHEANEGLVTANKRLIEDLECAKIIENYAMFFLFWVIEIECRPRADGDEF